MTDGNSHVASLFIGNPYKEIFTYAINDLNLRCVSVEDALDHRERFTFESFILFKTGWDTDNKQECLAKFLWLWFTMLRPYTDAVITANNSSLPLKFYETLICVCTRLCIYQEVHCYSWTGQHIFGYNDNFLMFATGEQSSMLTMITQKQKLLDIYGMDEISVDFNVPLKLEGVKLSTKKATLRCA